MKNTNLPTKLLSILILTGTICVKGSTAEFCPDNFGETESVVDSLNTNSDAEYMSNPPALLDCYASTSISLASDGSFDVSVAIAGLGYCCEWLSVSDAPGGVLFVSGSIGYNVVGVEAGSYLAEFYCVGSPDFGCPSVTFNVVQTPIGGPNDIETNDTPATALPMGENASVDGHIGFRRNGGSYDNHDLYAVTVTDYEGLHINADFSSVNANKALIVYASDYLTMLGSSYDTDENGNIEMDVEGLGPGVYYIDVYSEYYCSTGYMMYDCAHSSYTLTTTVTDDGFSNDPELNNTIATAVSMPENSSAEGNVGHFIFPGYDANDNSDFYQLITTEDGDIQVDVNTSLPFGSVYLYDIDGWTVLGNVYFTAPGFYSFTSTGLAAGTYYIQVIGNYPYPGGYEITNTVTHALLVNDVEPNDDFASALPMPAVGAATGHISYYNNGGGYNTVDYYTVNLPATGDLEITLNTTASLFGMTLYNSAGFWMAGTTGPPGILTINATALPADDYYIELSGMVDFEGWYTLSTNFSCPDPSISVSGPTAFCEGGSVTLTVAPGYDSYLWSNGDITNSITVTDAGDYSCDVSWNGCTMSSSDVTVDVFANPVPEIVADGALEFCLGESINLMVTSPFASYVWSNGATTDIVNIMGWGDYSVVVTDANGCQGISNVISVLTWGVPVISIAAASPIICYEGSVMLTATSTDPVQWMLEGVDIPGATSLTFNASTAGHYTCRATNGACSVESNVIKLKNAARVNTIPSGEVPLCTPTVLLSVPADPGATYQWYEGTNLIPGETLNVYSASAPNKYHCLITNAGCTRASKVIKVVPCRIADDQAEMVEIHPNPTSQLFNVTYSVNHPGAVIISMTDLTGRETQLKVVERNIGTWQDEFSAEMLAPGLYIITIKDSSGLVKQTQLIISK